MEKQPAQHWFNELKQIWLSKNIPAVRNILSESFEYYEDPFQDPFTTWTQVENIWQEVKGQNIIKLDIEPLVCRGQEGSAQYYFKYISIAGEMHESKGVYYVKLDQDGRAIEFRQWWMSK